MNTLPDDVRSRIDSIYVAPTERWVASLVVGYDGTIVPDAKEAALSALELTRDGGQHHTVWHVLDRQTGHTWQLEQGSFDPRCQEGGQ